MPEAFPGAIITFPMLGESFSLNPSGTYTLLIPQASADILNC